MDVEAAIATKRAIRSFADRPLEPDRLRRILDAGRHAGSSKNLQRWDFVVVTEREQLRALSGVGPWAGHVADAAVAVALVTPDPAAPDQPLSVVWDLGGAAAQMMLAAWGMGVGSCPATVYEQDLARSILGYPPDRHCGFLLSFGYPADPARLTDPPRPGRRRRLSEIVHEGHW